MIHGKGGENIRLFKRNKKIKNETDSISLNPTINDLNSIIKKVNDKIHGLTGGRDLNIIDFSIASIEVSFNIFNVEDVDRYIELFNLIFKDKNDKRYKNYALENNKELYSFIVRFNYSIAHCKV